MNNILWLVLGHYLLDYPLQTDYMANNKCKELYIMFVHSVIYGLGISFILNVVGEFIIYDAIILVMSHMMIDSIKCRLKNNNMGLYIDQSLHLLINIGLYLY